MKNPGRHALENCQNEVARVESKYPNALTAKELYDLLDHFKYIVPQGSPMTGIGNDYQVASLSNCFVIGVDGAATLMALSSKSTKNRYNS